MGVTEDLADQLAQDAMQAEKDMDDGRLIDDMARMLGDTSSTMKDAFLAAVRVRKAEARARKMMEARVQKHSAGG